MDKKQVGDEDKEGQVGDVGISTEVQANQQDLVMVKVAVEVVEKIDRRYKCRFLKNIPAALKNLEIFRRVDSGV